ncbi:arginase family protein [Microbacterium sp. LRZ72]|uniref:arginase family protein n=1 Tax=Microbacterium sp. LRZ72 TaxID=2942481 RepID=UPI0029B020ED|nr:arginase family protein [Microbacterium sp. LRZ72]MDX2378079.1 arginase family protein [Microbacterium sp. LRZ72]
MTRFVVVPQWQGSASSRAMRLIDGALAIAGDLPRAATHVLEAPSEAGDGLGTGVRRLSALRHTGERIRESAAPSPDAPHDAMVMVGGDSGVATAAALVWAEGVRRAGRAPGVLWLSAHPALRDAESSDSGAFSSMAARALVDAAVPAPIDLPRLDRKALTLTAARSADEADRATAERLGVTLLGDLETDPLVAAVAGADELFVHVALDVLDPSAIVGVTDPSPFGPDTPALVAAVRAVRARVPVTGGALTGFAPATPEDAVEDLGTILRIIGALT